MTIKQRLAWFSDRNLFMLFLWKDRFLNPLIPEQQHKLKTSGLLEDDTILKVLETHFPVFEAELPKGMYFPVPISRALAQGEKFSAELALRFYYDFIKVDESQQWSLRNKIITGKILSLFKSNMFYEKETGRYFVEYLSDARWDKCYLECAITPILALAIDSVSEGFQLQLNNDKTDLLVLNSFRIDKKERCFVRSVNFGEVLLADSPRFWLLDHLDDTRSHLVVNKHRFRLIFSS